MLVEHMAAWSHVRVTTLERLRVEDPKPGTAEFLVACTRVLDDSVKTGVGRGSDLGERSGVSCKSVLAVARMTACQVCTRVRGFSKSVASDRVSVGVDLGLPGRACPMTRIPRGASGREVSPLVCWQSPVSVCSLTVLAYRLACVRQSKSSRSVTPRVRRPSLLPVPCPLWSNGGLVGRDRRMMSRVFMSLSTPRPATSLVMQARPHQSPSAGLATSVPP